MENNPSKKKFRGFKYSVLALLIFAAFGLAWYSINGPQSGEQQASKKEKASSFMADAKEQGKSLMDKAGDIKGGIGDTIAEGRDRVTAMASDVGDKAGEMVQAASNAGSDLVERAQSTTDSGKEWIKDVTSDVGSGDTTEMESTGSSSDMPEQASNVFSEGQSKVETMMGDASGPTMDEASGPMTDTPSMSMKEKPSLSFNSTPSDMMSDTASEEMAGDNGKQMSAGGDKMSGMAKERMSAPSAETRMADADRSESAMSDSPMSDRMSDNASAKVEKMSSKATAQESEPSGSSLRCVGPPPKGEDKGDHYIVAVCETMSIISERTGVGMEDLKNRNPQVENPDLIFPNQRLWLPPRG